MFHTLSFHTFCRHVLVIFVLAAAAFISAPAQALTIRCVGNVTQLSAALTEANASTDTNFIIRVRTGTYDASQAVTKFEFGASEPDQVIELSGGWSGSGNTCQSRSLDPSLTVLLGTPSRSALTFGTTTTTNQGSVAYVNGFTLRNPLFSESGVACLDGFARGAGEMRAERLHLRQCVALLNQLGSYGAARFDNNGARLTVRDVTVHDNSGHTIGGIFAITTQGGVTALSQISITHSLATSDQAAGSGLFLQNYSGGTSHLSNSVVWGNDAAPATVSDIAISGNGIFRFTRVHYGSLSGTPTSNNTPSTGDPGFVAPGDAHLRADSLLIDSGVSNPQGGTGTYDADGKARVQGAGVDVGAFEATPVVNLSIFHNGFE